jgi:uncharacterized protein (DUF433 family)
MSIAPGLVDIGSFIDQREGYRGGRPFIVGTGVTVDAIACRLTVDKMGPQEIAENFNLSLAQVMAALAFYVANRDAIEEDLDLQEQENAAAAREFSERFGRLVL